MGTVAGTWSYSEKGLCGGIILHDPVRYKSQGHLESLRGRALRYLISQMGKLRPRAGRDLSRVTWQGG